MRRKTLKRRFAILIGVFLCSSFILMILIKLSVISVREDFCDGCNPHPINLTIKLSSHPYCSDEEVGPFLTVVVNSRPESRARRDLIRRFWASSPLTKEHRIRVAFMFGQSPNPEINERLKREGEECKDVLQNDFIDSYANIALKTRLGLAWVTQSCPKSKYIVKMDDDIKLDLDRVINYLKEVKDDLFIGGSCLWACPKRSPFDKWYVGFRDYPHLTYPEYCHGFTTFYAAKAAKLVYVASRDVPFFPFDDVYFTGLVANQFLGLRLTNIPWMSYPVKDQFEGDS